jgi:hypothetical protein
MWMERIIVPSTSIIQFEYGVCFFDPSWHHATLSIRIEEKLGKNFDIVVRGKRSIGNIIARKLVGKSLALRKSSCEDISCSLESIINIRLHSLDFGFCLC